MFDAQKFGQAAALLGYQQALPDTLAAVLRHALVDLPGHLVGVADLDQRPLGWPFDGFGVRHRHQHIEFDLVEKALLPDFLVQKRFQRQCLGIRLRNG